MSLGQECITSADAAVTGHIELDVKEPEVMPDDLRPNASEGETSKTPAEVDSENTGKEQQGSKMT